MTLLLVALGGAVGSAARHLVGIALPGRLGTLLVNVVASLLLGLLLEVTDDGPSLALLATGLCGGLSTYSAFALQVARPTHTKGEGPTGSRVGYAVGTLALCVVAALVGAAVGRSL